MKTLAKLTATLALGAAFAVTFTQAMAAEEKPTNSKEAAKLLKAAQEAINAKPPKYQDAIARLRDVDALPKKSPYDEYVMNNFASFAYGKLGDYANAEKALEAMLPSQYLPQNELPMRVRQLTAVNYQLKNWEKVIDYGTRSVKGGYADDQAYQIVAQAYYLKADYRNTIKFTDDFVATELKKGETPKEDTLQLILSSCVKLEDSPCITHALERMVTYYPKQEYWQNLLESMFRDKGAAANDKLMLEVYRLAADVDTLHKPDEFREMAQLALDAGSPGEAQRILEKGFAKNVFADPKDKERNQRLLDSAKKQAASDQAALPKVEAEVANATTGDKEVSLGLAYLSYAQYDKAVAALNHGLAKGGVRNEAEARLLLGIAQLKAGNKDEATKAFRGVKGDPTLERLANLWTLHAQQA